MPSQWSSEAKDLVWRMLVVESKRRIRMQDTFTHPFILKYPPTEGEIEVPDLPSVERPDERRIEVNIN